jgi:hypothetical protein
MVLLMFLIVYLMTLIRLVQILTVLPEGILLVCNFS